MHDKPPLVLQSIEITSERMSKGGIKLIFYIFETKPKTTMRKVLLILTLGLFAFHSGTAQINLFSGCENVTAFHKDSHPDIGIVISSGDAETVWNALRLAIAAQSKGDTVVVFVLNKAVDVFLKDSSQFEIAKTSEQFVAKGGDIFTCGTCAKMRHTENVQMCTITSLFDLYAIVKQSKKVISF